MGSEMRGCEVDSRQADVLGCASPSGQAGGGGLCLAHIGSKLVPIAPIARTGRTHPGASTALHSTRGCSVSPCITEALRAAALTRTHARHLR